jgi:hypothetical protein
MIDLWSRIIALVIDPHRAGIVEHLDGFVAEFGLVQKFLHITQAIRPAVVAFAGEGPVIRDFCALVEEEGSAFIATTSAASSIVVFTTTGLQLGRTIGGELLRFLWLRVSGILGRRLTSLASLPGFTWIPTGAFFASSAFLAFALRHLGRISGL